MLSPVYAMPQFPLLPCNAWEQVTVVVRDSFNGPIVEVEPACVDLPATTMVFGFRKGDAPLVGAMVTGKFVPKDQDTSHILRGKTDSRGQLLVVLPAGMVQSGMAAIDEEGEEVRLHHECLVPEMATRPDARSRTITTVTAVDSSSFEEIVAVNQDPMSMVVVLGDISASMLVDDKMESLRR